VLNRLQNGQGSKVYKAFNQTGFNIMADSVLEGRRAVMFVCGDDEAGKSIVLKLTEEVGFEAINAGKLSSARLLEPTPCWIKLASAYGQGRNFAFAIVSRS